VILYGRNPVREALAGRRASTVVEVWATPAAAREPWLRRAPLRIVDAAEIAARSGSDAHQGVCAELGPYPYLQPETLLAGAPPWLVVLDQVQDPQNLGSICRTAECVGVDGVVIGQRRSAEVTPAVCKASAGAVEHVALARVRNIADFLLAARRADCWCYGASAERELGEGGRAVSYLAPDYSGGVVLVLGSEGRGLRPRVATVCDQLISLPMLGRVESLGVGAAAAAIMYRILQDRPAGLDKVS
jgi:23S rRNA (guanosine2251-2'-O)-methyltransferase